MAKQSKIFWTIVQHSGYILTKHRDLMHSVEDISVSDPRTIEAIRKAGGKLFEDYTEARDYAEKENYPPGHKGLEGGVRGKFAERIKVGGCPIYIPPSEALAEEVPPDDVSVHIGPFRFVYHARLNRTGMFDVNDLLINLPGRWSEDQLNTIADLYRVGLENGRKAGREEGKAYIRTKFRELLGEE